LSHSVFSRHGKVKEGSSSCIFYGKNIISLTWPHTQDSYKYNNHPEESAIFVNTVFLEAGRARIRRNRERTNETPGI